MSWWLILVLSLFLLWLLCMIESPLQYTAKMTMFGVIFLGLALLTLPIGLLRPFNPENHKVLAWIVPYLNIYLLGISVEVRDGHNTKLNRPFVLLLNHQSAIDSVIMMHIWPDRCVTMMKRVLIYIFPFSITASLFGCVFINRTNKNQAMSVLEHAGRELNQRKLQFCMFPEGTRNRSSNTLLPFKKGAFNLAVGAKVPLVPAVMSCYTNFYDKKANKFTHGKVILTVLPPVETTGKEYSDVPELSESVRQSMIEVYQKTSKEMNPNFKEE
ncbi:1-acyl-sn-glycerol-3-phosphate acyltransferase alpha-like [Watersipora subatra]|uniref:1-acyl-sn-glycerol-3-phosphate acyltransferase alpha-like n=1 Tax=Watersipora subatra TaxID=2589382 RepID=UPI00355B0C28